MKQLLLVLQVGLAEIDLGKFTVNAAILHVQGGQTHRFRVQGRVSGLGLRV